MSNQAENQVEVQAKGLKINWDECYANNTTVSVTPLLRYAVINTPIERSQLATYDWSKTRCLKEHRWINWEVHHNTKVTPLVNKLAEKIKETSGIKYPIKCARSALEAEFNKYIKQFKMMSAYEEIQVAKRRYQAEIRMVKRVFPMQDRDCLGLICEYAYGELGSAIYDPTPAVVYTGRRLKIKVKKV